jgi:uncharacterized protein (DUF58 family)
MSTTQKFDPADLLDSALMARLDALQVLTHRVFRGGQKGERRSRRKGLSIDFADYRDYVRGDDTRFLDWNIFARLEKLFIKLFMEEEDLAFHILLDRSRSMDFGTPVTKFDFGRRLSAALAYVALLNQDKVGVSAFAGRGSRLIRPMRGKGQLPKILKVLGGLTVEPTTCLEDSIRDFVSMSTQSGVVVVISDFLDPAGVENALKYFYTRPYEVYLVHVLSPEERNPTEVGHLELLDSETGERQEVTLNEALRRQYARTLEGFCRSIREWAVARGMSYIPASSDQSIDAMLLNYLRREGLVG